MQLLIYCPKVTPRIKYIFNFIFREVLAGDFELTSIADDFIASTQPKFSYAEKPLADELFFCAAPLLAEHTITPVDFAFADFGDQKVPFAVENSALPFDVFAASFYFLSRYEEYLPFEADEHQRFRAELSLQYKLGLLAVPIIDAWALILKNILLKAFPALTFAPKKFRFVPTIDIDRAYHFRSSGLLKNTIRFFKAARQLKTEKMFSIIKTGLGNNDPFDTYDYLKKNPFGAWTKSDFLLLTRQAGQRTFRYQYRSQRRSVQKPDFRNGTVRQHRLASILCFEYRNGKNYARTAKPAGNQQATDRFVAPAFFENPPAAHLFATHQSGYQPRLFNGLFFASGF